jgi:hypothetical protein
MSVLSFDMGGTPKASHSGLASKRDARHLSLNTHSLGTNLNTEAIVLALLGKPVKTFSSATDWRYGRKGGLSVNIGNGVWFAHDGDQGGGILDLVVWLNHAHCHRSAAQWLSQNGLLSTDSTPYLRSRFEALKTDDAVHRKRNAALQISHDLQPIKESPAWTYLTEIRCIPPSMILGLEPEDLGYAPKAPIYPYDRSGPKCPAMVASVRDSKLNLIGVHITYLRPDGSGKADLAINRKMCGSGFLGSHVRLFASQKDREPPHAIIVAEGIESALSCGLALNLPPVAALSVYGVKAFIPWDGLEEITFAPDNDSSGVGIKAAQDGAQRLHDLGFKINGYALPPRGHNDWNDVLINQAQKGGDHV